MSIAVARSHDREHSGDSLRTYLDEISVYPMLSREQEAELARQIQGGDHEALNRLVCANLRFVVSVAKKYRHQGVALHDLINEGNLGLVRAAERFDGGKGVKFISYAVWWVRQAVIQAISDQAHTVRVPPSAADAARRINRQASVLRQQLGRDPTRHELAETLDVSEEHIEAAMPVSRPYLSLDASYGPEDGPPLLDTVRDEAASPADDQFDDGAVTDWATQALASLRPRDAEVIRLYFGFDGKDALTLEDIGARLHITRERVRQIRDRALSMLRRGQPRALLLALKEQ